MFFSGLALPDSPSVGCLLRLAARDLVVELDSLVTRDSRALNHNLTSEKINTNRVILLRYLGSRNVSGSRLDLALSRGDGYLAIGGES